MADSPVVKALVLLHRLAERGEPVGVKQLAGDAGLNVSTAHRLLRTLAAEEMVHHDPHTRLYGIGPGCVRFAAKVLGGGSLSTRIGPVVRALAEQLEETCAFSLYDQGTFTKAIALVERGPQPLGYDYEPGERDGIHAGASGKAILAFLPDEQIERMLAGPPLPALTENTIVDPAALRRELNGIRERGFATSTSERVAGAGFGIGAPVFGARGHVIGSLVVTVPLFRWRRRNLAPVSAAVMDHARMLSDLLRHERSPVGHG